jgi:hypothetical protein
MAWVVWSSENIKMMLGFWLNAANVLKTKNNLSKFFIAFGLIDTS